MINICVFQGNLTRDAELVGKEQNVARFTVAVNNGFGDNKETAFIDCVAFGKQIETIKEYFSKGKQVIVKGKMRQNNWEDKDGGKRSKLELVLDNFEGFSFVSGGSGGQKAETEAPAEAANGNGKLF